MRKIRWEKVQGNPLWLRGVRTRNPNPTSFTQAMEPERNVTYDEMIPVLDQSVEQGMRVSWIGQSLIAFESEEDLTLFLLRWS
jgi:hypothetical protein